MKIRSYRWMIFWITFITCFLEALLLPNVAMLKLRYGWLSKPFLQTFYMKNIKKEREFTFITRFPYSKVITLFLLTEKERE